MPPVTNPEMISILDQSLKADAQKQHIANESSRMNVPPPVEAGALPPPQQIIPPEAAQQGQQRSAAEARKVSGQLTRHVVVPAAQAGLGFATGGLSLPVQMAIGGGAELAAQQTGLAEKSPLQVAAAALIPGVVPALKAGGRAIGQMFAPGAFREAGTEAVAKIAGVSAPGKFGIGKTGDVVERAFQAPLSGKFYDLARKAGSMQTGGLKTAVDDAIMAEQKLANPTQGAIKVLSNVSRKFASQGTASFDDVINEVQRIDALASKAFKAKNNVTGKTLADAADVMAEHVSTANPAYQAATKRYLRERTAKNMIDAIRDGNSGTKLTKLIDHEASRVSKAFSKDELNEMRKVANQVSEAVANAGEGFANRTFNAFTKPISDMLESRTGRALLSNTLGTPKAGPAAFHAALQFWRAYEAQGGDE